MGTGIGLKKAQTWVKTGPVRSLWDPEDRHCEVVLVGPEECFDGAAAKDLVELLRQRVGAPTAAPYTVVVDLRHLSPGTAAWRRTMAAALMAERRHARLVGYNAVGVPRAIANLFLRGTGLEAALFRTEAEARAWLASR